MTEDFIRYDVLVQGALRRVIRDVLNEIAKSGLPGNHHFYFTFLTGAPGVRLSRGLFTRYPREMTIVLHHEYSDLFVGEDFFSVELTFSGVRELLRLPFSAISTFHDPSVPFHVQFAHETYGHEVGRNSKDLPSVGKPPAVEVPIAANVVSLEAFRKR